MANAADIVSLIEQSPIVARAEATVAAEWRPDADDIDMRVLEWLVSHVQPVRVELMH